MCVMLAAACLIAERQAGEPPTIPTPDGVASNRKGFGNPGEPARAGVLLEPASGLLVCRRESDPLRPGRPGRSDTTGAVIWQPPQLDNTADLRGSRGRRGPAGNRTAAGGDAPTASKPRRPASSLGPEAHRPSGYCEGPLVRGTGGFPTFPAEVAPPGGRPGPTSTRGAAASFGKGAADGKGSKGGAESESPVEEHRRLLDAIRFVESGGRDDAVGDGGRSRGPYQIGVAYWRDGCEAGRVQWDYHASVWSRARSEQVMRWYWKRHGATTDAQRARMHNGGPRGHRRPSTLTYWRRVRAAMRPEETEATEGRERP